MERTNTVTQPYWDGIDEGKLLLQHCAGCDALQYYPRPQCSKCQSPALDWKQAIGTGALYSYSIVQRGPSPAFQSMAPYVVAIVELDEGPRIFTNIIDSDLNAIAVGQAVALTIREGPEGLKLPYFKLVSD